jgi:hypothetical protein
VDDHRRGVGDDRRIGARYRRVFIQDAFLLLSPAGAGGGLGEEAGR